MERQITNVNEYRLVESADAFVAAIEALARRTEAEGEPGVLRYAFHVNRAEGTAGATIVYRDADAWLEHHRIAYQWDEMSALQATVQLERIAFIGPLSEEIRSMAAGIPAPVVYYGTLAAGFVRS